MNQLPILYSKHFPWVCAVTFFLNRPPCILVANLSQHLKLLSKHGPWGAFLDKNDCTARILVADEPTSLLAFKTRPMGSCYLNLSFLLIVIFYYRCPQRSDNWSDRIVQMSSFLYKHRHGKKSSQLRFSDEYFCPNLLYFFPSNFFPLSHSLHKDFLCFSHFFPYILFLIILFSSLGIIDINL